MNKWNTQYRIVSDTTIFVCKRAAVSQTTESNGATLLVNCRDSEFSISATLPLSGSAAVFSETDEHNQIAR